ncbi:MAG: DUF3575 domain-containing protein [Bacteroidaceae bacterium]
MCFCSWSVYGQRVGVKSNLLYDMTTSMNLGMEVGIGKKATIDISGNYNPFNLGDHRQLKHWLIQPEFRWWLCERFNGSFFGVHAHYASYNVASKKYRYQGSLYGAGLSYGYQWILNKSWSIETEVGLGYARLKYDKYPCHNCGSKLEDRARNYFGPTKLAISLIYLIK